MLRRIVSQLLEISISDTPVILVNGARQTGKTTLIQRLASKLSAEYYTFDDEATLYTAREDPRTFLTRHSGCLALDEIQRIPELFPVIKQLVDEDRRPGRFLLSGSANILLLPKLSESLAGRMEIITLYPMAQCELAGQLFSWVDWLVEGKWPIHQSFQTSRIQLCEKIIRGGYPEISTRASDRVSAWFQAYLNALLQKDVRDLSNIEGLTEMPRLLSMLSTRISQLFNLAELSRSTGIAQTTLKRYLTLLEALFLYDPLPAWSTNLSKRLVKANKTYLCDTGLAAYAMGIDSAEELIDHHQLGLLLECFVYCELKRHLSWSKQRARLFHFRQTNGIEVDFLLETPQGTCIAIEVKATSRITDRHTQGLKTLQAVLKERLTRGILLYTGDKILPLGKDLTAIPIASFWQNPT